MQTINNRMTETQIADLFSLAVQLQVKAEESDDRDTAIFAYSIQNACSNLTESRREFRSADATIHNLELKITDLAVQLANAESKCRGLAADNAGLKALIPENWQMHDVLHQLIVARPGGVYFNKWEKLIIGVLNETPATDAFLAEVRAQARNELIDELESRFNEMTETLPPELRSGAAGAAAFVSTFRKGAAL